MVPSGAALIQTAASAVKRILAANGSSSGDALLQAISVALNELLLREDAGFYEPFCARGRALACDARALLGEPPASEAPGSARVDDADAVMAELAALTDRLTRAATPAATAWLDRVVDWEVDLLAHRMREADQIAGEEDPVARLTGERFEAYLRARRPQWPDAKVVAFAIHPGGFSKITAFAEVHDANGGRHEIALRAEPTLRMLDSEGMLLANEYPVVRLVHAAGLPVAEPLWFEPDTAPLGMAFMVSQRMPGRITGSAMGSNEVPPPARLDALFTALARLHAVPIDPQDPFVRASHLRRWAGHATLADNTRAFIAYWAELAAKGDIPVSPLYTRAINWLAANVPEEDGASALLHGDLTFANILFEGDRISAILDWENTRIGDPADELSNIVLGLRGKVDRDEILARYAAAGGGALSEYRLRYFDVYHCVKMTIAALVSLRQVERAPNGRVHLAMFGLRFLHYVASQLNALIAAAEAARDAALAPAG